MTPPPPPLPIHGLSTLFSFSVRLFSTRRCFWLIPKKREINPPYPKTSNSKAYSLEAKKRTFGKIEDSKQFVRKVTAPEKFHEEDSVQLNIAYSNFFHLKVTDKQARRVDKRKREVMCVHVFSTNSGLSHAESLFL